MMMWKRWPLALAPATRPRGNHDARSCLRYVVMSPLNTSHQRSIRPEKRKEEEPRSAAETSCRTIEDMKRSILLASLILAAHARAFSSPFTSARHHRPPAAVDLGASIVHRPSSRRVRGRTVPSMSSELRARPRSKWDDLVDEEDDDDDFDGASSSSSSGGGEVLDGVPPDVPPDMLYNEENVQRQADTYDQLESIGGDGVVNDVYVRAPGKREWWLVGKVARISGE